MIKHKEIFFLLLSAAIVLFITVGTYGVVETSDARYAEIGREMFQSGDWLRPNLLDVHHYHKPPVTYQITALGYELFGVNPFGVRFFLQIAILVQIFLVYLLTLQFIDNKKVALWAGAIYFSFPMVLIVSRNLTTDAFLTTFVLLSIYAWTRYRKGENFLWLYIFTLSLGLGFLTKGPVVFLAPVIFALLFNKKTKSKNTWQLHHLLSWTLFFVIATSWFFYLMIDNPAFWDYFVGKQTVDRFSHNVFNRSEPFWYFIVLAPFLGMPWLFLAPWFVKKLHFKFNLAHIETILLFTVAICILFFSISTSKRIFYILPLYPLLAVSIALMLYKLPTDKENFILRFVSGYALMIFIALGLAPWVQHKITFPPVLTAVSLLLSLLLFWFWKQVTLDQKSKSVIITFVTSVYILLAGTYLFSYSVNAFKIATPVTTWIKQHHLEKKEILVYNRRLPSVAFELNRSIISLYDGASSLNREVQFEKDTHWKKYLYNLQQEEERKRLEKLMNEHATLLISYKKEVPEWLKTQYKARETIGKWSLYY